MPDKVTQWQMEIWLDAKKAETLEPVHLSGHEIPPYIQEQLAVIQAIRALILAAGEWTLMAKDIMDEDDTREICADKICILARNIRDFGEGGG